MKAFWSTISFPLIDLQVGIPVSIFSGKFDVKISCQHTTYPGLCISFLRAVLNGLCQVFFFWFETAAEFAGIGLRLCNNADA